MPPSGISVPQGLKFSLQHQILDIRIKDEETRKANIGTIHVLMGPKSKSCSIQPEKPGLFAEAIEQHFFRVVFGFLQELAAETQVHLRDYGTFALVP